MTSTLIQFFYFAILVGAVPTFAQTATYSVPVNNPAATNDVRSIHLTKAGTQVFLDYELPEDLVGQTPLQIHMLLVSSLLTPEGYVLKFKDNGGWSLCQEIPNGLSCVSDYDSLNYDAASRLRFLNQKYASNPTQLQMKVAVANTFASDPIGLLKVHCDVRLCGLLNP